MSNTWPEGRRRAMLQSEHDAWNANRYPGTRQLCSICGEPTGRCEGDSLFINDNDDEDDGDPVCVGCWKEARDGELVCD